MSEDTEEQALDRLKIIEGGLGKPLKDRLMVIKGGGDKSQEEELPPNVVKFPHLRLVKREPDDAA